MALARHVAMATGRAQTGWVGGEQGVQATLADARVERFWGSASISCRCHWCKVRTLSSTDAAAAAKTRPSQRLSHAW